MQYLLDNKKIFIALAFIILIPFIIPILDVIVKCILNYGRLIGSNMRYIEEGICFKKGLFINPFLC